MSDRLKFVFAEADHQIIEMAKSRKKAKELTLDAKLFTILQIFRTMTFDEINVNFRNAWIEFFEKVTNHEIILPEDKTEESPKTA